VAELVVDGLEVVDVHEGEHEAGVGHADGILHAALVVDRHRLRRHELGLRGLVVELDREGEPRLGRIAQARIVVEVVVRHREKAQGLESRTLVAGGLGCGESALSLRDRLLRVARDHLLECLRFLERGRGKRNGHERRRSEDQRGCESKQGTSGLLLLLLRRKLVVSLVEVRSCHQGEEGVAHDSVY